MPHDSPVSRSIYRHAQNQALDLNGFDFNARAELFPSRNKSVATHARYRRFNTAAEAVRFAIEEVPAPALKGAYLEVNEARFGIEEIRYLYDNAAFPLPRSK